MTIPVTITPNVLDVTDETFEAEVLQRSHHVPVVVDFWAEWCGPCRMLGPILERLALEYQGKFILAKLDVDSNPLTSRKYYVQGIPAVKAFAKGQMFNEFTGALPEPQVRKFLDAVVPSEADLLARQGFEWEVNDQPAMAESMYRAALVKKADHYPSQVALGRVLLATGKIDEALSILEKIPEGLPERSTANALIASAEFQRIGGNQNEADLENKLASDPGDVDSHFALANLLAAEERYLEALAEFLEVVRRDRSYNDDAARKAMLALFTTIGEDQQLVREYRQKLANALF